MLHQWISEPEALYCERCGYSLGGDLGHMDYVTADVFGGRCDPPTPWGQADETVLIDIGITWYSTPSHGGYRVSGQARDNIPQGLRELAFAGDPWYEEDCDAAIVVAFNDSDAWTDGAREEAAKAVARQWPEWAHAAYAAHH